MEYNKVMNENVFSSIRVRLLFVRCERDMRREKKWRKKMEEEKKKCLVMSWLTPLLSRAYAYIMLAHMDVSRVAVCRRSLNGLVSMMMMTKRDLHV